MMKKYYFLVILILTILIINFMIVFKKGPAYSEDLTQLSATFILPYNYKLWLVDRNGKIFDLIQCTSEFKNVPVIKIPRDFIDEINGIIKEGIFKFIPENIPSIIFEINFEDNSFKLLNNAKIYYEDISKLAIYFENLKVWYKYTNFNEIYYIKDDMLVKVR
jgi:hypothetical protein